MNALVLAPFSKPALDRLGQRLKVTYESWMETKKLYSPQELIERIRGEGLEVLVVEADFVQRDVLEKADKLRLLGVCRADTNLVDLQAATEHGVVVVNTPARNAVAVAELAIGLMLSVARRIPVAHTMVSSHQWTDPMMAYMSFRGSELTGKTIGIVGFGAIGRQVAKRLGAFDTTILVYDPYVPGDEIRSLNGRPEDLDRLMAESDVVTLHIPVTPETMGLIDARRIEMMKPAACLVNTASTYVVDGNAVAKALREKRIAGAAFDVFDAWPARADDPLLEMDNVVLTPHIGGATWETIERYSMMIADDIERFLDGERPVNLCNSEVWNGQVRQSRSGG